jgi:hypothetical protein
MRVLRHALVQYPFDSGLQQVIRICRIAGQRIAKLSQSAQPSEQNIPL